MRVLKKLPEVVRAGRIGRERRRGTPRTGPASLFASSCRFLPAARPTRLARLLQPYLQQSLGVAVVVDNRAARRARFGSGMAAKAPPDGYTFLLVFRYARRESSLIPEHGRSTR